MIIMEMIKDIGLKYDIKNMETYGNYMSKVKGVSKMGKGKVVLVTATNPTKYGEGKTTVAIGLNDAINKCGYKSLASLREPSMGPTFGLKGGATGGGMARILPENEINLHFTGDFHAITTANNLISSLIDNEIFHDNKLDIQSVTFNRCIDLNDRSLRNIKLNDREEHFDITAASEIMSVMMLAKDIDDLRYRLNNIIIGYNSRLAPIHVSSLGITDALVGILEKAFDPNFVQTSEGNGCFVHTGPFANISLGCSSLISLSTATNYADYVITEAGFGADAGAFKFMDILTRDNKIDLGCIVLVTTIRALKYNGNGSLEEGIVNLKAHVNNLKLMNNNIIVTLNRFEDDDIDDIRFISDYANAIGVEFVVNDIYNQGGIGGIELAEKVMHMCENKSQVNYLYKLDDNLYDKINSYVTNICHADGFNCSLELMSKLKNLDKYKYPICVAKTQYSLSDDKKLLGSPVNYKMTLTDVKVYNGAGIIVCYFGNILTMPGLNDEPSVKEFKYLDGDLVLPR